MLISGEIRNNNFSKRRIYRNNINKKGVFVRDIFEEYLFIILYE